MRLPHWRAARSTQTSSWTAGGTAASYWPQNFLVRRACVKNQPMIWCGQGAVPVGLDAGLYPCLSLPSRHGLEAAESDATPHLLAWHVGVRPRLGWQVAADRPRGVVPDDLVPQAQRRLVAERRVIVAADG